MLGGMTLLFLAMLYGSLVTSTHTSHQQSVELRRSNESLEKEVAERRRVEKALQASERRYRLLVETMSDGLGMQDANGRFTCVNPRFAEMLGYPAAGICGRAVTEFLDEKNRGIYRRESARRRQGAREACEIAWTRRDGSEIATIISPMPLVDEAGGYGGSFAVVTDITRRTQAEEKLRDSEQRWRQLFENMRDG